MKGGHEITQVTQPSKAKAIRVKTAPAVQRERVGLTLEQLAPLARISAATLRRTEQGGTDFYHRAQWLAEAINKAAEGQGLAQTAKAEDYINPRRAALAALAQGEAKRPQPTN